jgi:PAS domain S-box-containing protein
LFEIKFCALRFSVTAAQNGTFEACFPMKLRTHLFLHALAFAVPLAVAAVLAIMAIDRQARLAARQEMEATARSAVMRVDADLATAQARLASLASSPYLQHGDWARFDAQVRTLDDGESPWLLVLDEDGRRDANPLQSAAPEVPGSYAQRISQVLGSRTPWLSDVRRGPTSGRLLTALFHPADTGGRRYVLAQVFDTGHFQQALQALRLPAGWTAALLDREGTVIASSSPSAYPPGLRVPPELAAAAQTAASGITRLHSRNEPGEAAYAFARAAEGWTMLVSAPAARIDGTVQRFSELASGGAIIATIALLVLPTLLLLFARRFDDEIEQVALAARALGAGHPAKPTGSRLVEVKQIKQSIDQVAGLLRVERESREAAFTAIFRSERQLESIIRNARDGVIVLDANRRIVMCNDAATRMFGQPREMIAGNGLDRLLDARSRAWCTWPRGGRKAAGRSDYASDLVGLRPGGRMFPLECSITTAGPDDGGWRTLIMRDISDRVRDRQALIDANEALRRATRDFHETLMAEVEARQADVARELHDSIGASLAGISLLLRGVQDRRGNDANELLTKTQGEVERTAKALRRIARGIMPAGSEPGALSVLLEQFAGNLDGLPGLACRLYTRGDFSDVPGEVATHIYRITQEAVNNALRHGGASRITIRLLRAGDRYRIAVKDNGSGCDMRHVHEHHEGLGLHSMQARARSIAGRFVISSSPGRGCTVRVSWASGNRMQGS